MGLDDLDPKLQDGLNEAGDKIYAAWKGHIFTEYGASVVQDNVSKKITTTDVYTDNSQRSVTPPTSVEGKTILIQTHIHTQGHEGSDWATGTEFSWQDMAWGYLSGYMQHVIQPYNGTQQLFAPPPNRKMAEEFRGGKVWEITPQKPHWTPKEARTDLTNPRVPAGQLRAFKELYYAHRASINQGALHNEPHMTNRHRNDMIIGDTGESDGNFSGIDPHLLRAGL
jgi:hypothetical protein